MFTVSIITFCLTRVIPGNPAEIMLRANGIEPTREAIENLRRELGLDAPLAIQYFSWAADILQGDFGRSYTTKRPVLIEVEERLPATLELTLGGVVIMLLLAFPGGVLAARFKNTKLDHLSRLTALLGASFPSYWLGLLLIYFLAVKKPFFPVTGGKTIRHLVLPALTLGLGMAATNARLLRASMLEILNQDFISVVRAKGLTERVILLKHVLKNALIPAITAFSISFGHLLGGTVIVETIFTWPGIGKFAVNAIFNRDYPVIQAYVLFMALVFVLVNTMVDIFYQLLDPRIELGVGTKNEE